MAQSVVLRYDGEALNPQEPVSLELKGRFETEMEEVELTKEGPTMNSAFARIIARAVKMDLDDLAEQHDHYLYGVPKH